MKKINRNKSPLIIAAAVIFVFLSAYAALAWGNCPKGEVNCTHPCRDWVDTNGNGICDLSEPEPGSDTAQSSTPESIEADVDSSTSTPSEQESEDRVVSPPSSDSDASSSVKSRGRHKGWSVESDSPPIQSEQDGRIAVPEDDNSETSSSQLQPETNPVTADSLGQALTEPQFLGTLLLLISALMVVRRKKPLYVRLFVLFLGLIYLGFYLSGCMCPVGVLANIPLRLAGIMKGQYNLWLLLFLLPIIFVYFGGRIFCGGVCPFGAVQEFTFRLGNLLGLNHSKPGLEKAPWLKYIKYIFLLAVILITPVTGTAWWCSMDPFGYLFNFSGTTLALILLLVLLSLSLFISRPWCRFICPYGALLGIIAKDIGLLTGKKLSIDKSACKSCRICERNCPVNAIRGDDIDEAECINCGECSERCKFNAINQSSKNSKTA